MTRVELVSPALSASPLCSSSPGTSAGGGDRGGLSERLAGAAEHHQPDQPGEGDRWVSMSTPIVSGGKTMARLPNITSRRRS